LREVAQHLDGPLLIVIALGVGGFGLQTTKCLTQATSFNVRYQQVLGGGKIKKNQKR
jgi:hypothetical protein